MQTKEPERGGMKSAPTPQPAKPPITQSGVDAIRAPGTVVGLSIGAALAVLISCAEPTSLGRDARRSAPVFLNATAAAAVRTVLADVSFRVSDAIEDGAARTQFETALRRLTDNIEAGRLDAAALAVGDARAALSSASNVDADGSGDADRAAIALAISVATEEITNARLAAGGR